MKNRITSTKTESGDDEGVLWVVEYISGVNNADAWWEVAWEPLGYEGYLSDGIECRTYIKFSADIDDIYQLGKYIILV